MSVTAIIQQPTTGSLHAAYRAINSRVVVDNIETRTPPPLVYCDIYINGIFFKTVTRSYTAFVNENESEFVFDIQDGIQEYLNRREISQNGGVVAATLNNICRVFCRYRSSEFSGDGFIIPDGVVPVQATSSSPAVPGNGLESNHFFVLNAILQHEDNQNLMQHLDYYKSRLWDNTVKPATHRPAKMNILIGQSDYYPILLPDDKCPDKIRLKYRLHDQSLIRTIDTPFIGVCSVTLSHLTAVQRAGVVTVDVAWISSEIVSAYQYRVDGGVWLTSTTTNVTLTSLALGAHTFEVRAVCNCANGESQTMNFNIQDPVTYICDSAVTSITLTQTAESTVSYSIAATIGAVKFKLELDGGTPFEVTSTTGTLNSLSIGTHSLKVTPVCSNGVEGTSLTQGFTTLGYPRLTLISSQVNAGDHVRVFKVGPHVNPGNKFTLEVFGINRTVTAVIGDTPATIAQKLVVATTLGPYEWYDLNGGTGNFPNPDDSEEWNSYGGQLPPITSRVNDEITARVSYPVWFNGSVSLT